MEEQGILNSQKYSWTKKTTQNKKLKNADGEILIPESYKNKNYNTGAKPNTTDSIRGPRCKSRPLEVWQRWKSHKSEKTASLTNGIGETGYLHAEEKTLSFSLNLHTNQLQMYQKDQC